LQSYTFASPTSQRKDQSLQKSIPALPHRQSNQRTDKQRKKEGQLVTRVWQKWRFSAPQTVLWLIKVWFSASTFVVKIATFANPENVMGKLDRPSGQTREPPKNGVDSL
jgi:hypothetical protein